MIDRYITPELLFTRCKNWNTPECPHLSNAIMGLSIINQDHLFLLSDETVFHLKKMCRRCYALKKNADSKP